MAIYEVYISPNFKPNSQTESGIKFVRDHTSVFALIVPIIWLIWNRLWLALAIYIVFMAVMIFSVDTKYGLVLSAISFIPALYLFLEGSALISADLRTKGWKMVGVVEANDRESAELKWFSSNVETHYQQSADIFPQPNTLKEKRSSLQTSPSRASQVPSIGKAEFGLFVEDQN